ncbi:cold-shock protein [Bombilactobacillus thymidiniphilus]|uniref:Cold shock domain-containing protein n=1 Tax=Bombilactobacillus thymidiniphilus TaxID=2923363 RepID=A0ABY4PDN0_9LACO|nr:cold shock domain-containing protein [Bombilactobacillus thymidiniphilus]UQS83783.1 cold shock domain-containing protein [Bombilactobacillus thymidiniphilus]
MITGTVDWFDEKKGIGELLTPTDEKIFVYFTAIQGEGFKTLNAGQKVKFEIAQGFKGLQAVNVRPVVVA